MVMPKGKYEELRQQTMAENKKKLDELHLPLLSQALQKASSPKTPPLKKERPRAARSELVAVRRSGRFSNKSAPVYREITFYDRIHLPRRVVYPKRDLSNRVYASDESREWATEKSEKFESTLEGDYPTFTRPMLPSHVSGGFWLGLPSYFCKKNLPRSDDTMTLVDEEGDEWPTIYLSRKCGLSGGWKKFSVDHDLVDGDALVFQLVQRTVFKVYITRVNGFEIENMESFSKVQADE